MDKCKIEKYGNGNICGLSPDFSTIYNLDVQHLKMSDRHFCDGHKSAISQLEILVNKKFDPPNSPVPLTWIEHI